MSVVEGPGGGPPSSELDRVVERFESAWKAGPRPNIDDHLPPGAAERFAVLVELVHVELELRLKAGEAARVEEYLQRFPELAQKAAVVVALLKSEYEQRRQREPSLSPEEYWRRFPQHEEQLRSEIGEFPSTIPPRNGAASVLTGPDVVREPEMPARLGRYRITARLGQGGFGVVYKAYDDELRREVAIKVPHRERIRGPGDAEVYLAEARIVAGLDHPHIVPVHDLGRTEDGLCFVVSKFIEGSNLAEKIAAARPSWVEAAELTATVAEALHYAHKGGLVHRDVKPGNILIDPTGKPYLADFGLALKEEDFGQGGGGVCGTPAYMSPEQANGEGHRVDGRSDIFSLGVVFYELLTGRRPFRGEMPHILARIVSDEPRPPRQINDAIPKELERICLKALAKRTSGRYTTAKDMADDLRHFLSGAEVGAASRAAPDAGPARLACLAAPTPSDKRPLKIVPKGLRSFDAADADFFLELLPGPRDRDGLPESIRFWKTRIEETDPDKTFTVGLIYGPSGCGKSSLVKAGLLPRLSDKVIAVCVEATAQETESRLLNGLHKRCPDLSASQGLRESLTGLRRGQGVPAGKKVLIVLDQFEQWLHAGRARYHGHRVSDRSDSELVQALRQCDGERVQCVALVRDDFWMAATRFLDELDIRLLAGQNSAAVDLFPIRHAEKVLAAFGRAFGALPENGAGKDAQAFVEQAVAGLAEDGKVICVRLALFAEMLKGRAWTPATLKEVGGAEGVGVTFLEETFSASTAPPEHRYHQKAARAVLRALLPEAGSDIKGHMRSQAALLAASGYAGRPKDFAHLLRILDGDLRLITPTDPEGGMESEPGALATGAGSSPVAYAPGSELAGTRYYQLTHDYLVPSLRDWLTRKQKETRRGRAELLLADRAAVWNARRENRQLPSLLQWLRIRLLTRKNDWTEPQRRMMRRARRYHAVRTVVVATGLFLAGLIGWEGFGRMRAQTLCDRLLDAPTANVPAIVHDMGPYRRWVNRPLREAAARAEDEGDARKRLHASVALLPDDPGQANYLYERMLKAEPEELLVIREALRDRKPGLTEDLWALLENHQHDQDERFRAACALAGYDPDNHRWEKVAGDVAAKMVAQHSLVVGKWVDVFGPAAGKSLLGPLAAFLADEKRTGTERELIAKVYGIYAADNPGDYARLDKVLMEKGPPNEEPESKLPRDKCQANVAAALLVMGRGEQAWPLLKHSKDPTRRSYLIERLGPGGADAKSLVAQLEREKDISIRRALLLSLGQFGLDRLPQVERQNLLPRLLELYRDDPDPGIHGAAEWLLRQWQFAGQLREIDRKLATGKAEGKRRWYVNRQGQTMVIVPRPKGPFWMGEGDDDMLRRHRRLIKRGYAIAAKEVTVKEFLEFHKKHKYSKQRSPTPDCPITDVSWHDAAAYCNWLSEKQGIPKDQWCYEVEKEGEEGPIMKPAPNYLQKAGYRLPTEAEWEYACRAGAETPYSFGEADELLVRYGWYSVNSADRSHPVGGLKPNDLGLFDMHGNAFEWCHDLGRKYPTSKGGGEIEDKEDLKSEREDDNRTLRGGAFDRVALIARSSFRWIFFSEDRDSFFGFRPARTYP
jgi:serine/threonine protein kinase/formylglycine-generating enzyme required for sulfatase activity